MGISDTFSIRRPRAPLVLLSSPPHRGSTGRSWRFCLQNINSLTLRPTLLQAIGSSPVWNITAPPPGLPLLSLAQEAPADVAARGTPHRSEPQHGSPHLGTQQQLPTALRAKAEDPTVPRRSRTSPLPHNAQPCTRPHLLAAPTPPPMAAPATWQVPGHRLPLLGRRWGAVCTCWTLGLEPQCSPFPRPLGHLLRETVQPPPCFLFPPPLMQH